MPAETASDDNGEGDPKKTKGGGGKESQHTGQSLWHHDCFNKSRQGIWGGPWRVGAVLEGACDRKKKENPLDWWKSNSGRFNGLYICFPPSSVLSERVFSVIGNIHEERRISDRMQRSCASCTTTYLCWSGSIKNNSATKGGLWKKFCFSIVHMLLPPYKLPHVYILKVSGMPYNLPVWFVAVRTLRLKGKCSIK